MNPLERIASLSPQKRALLAQRNPLSFSQQRLWFLDQLEPGNPFYNILLAVRLEGPLDEAALARVLAEIVRRHQILRTTFPAVDGQPLQLVSAAAEVVPAVVDLSRLPRAEREAEARRLAEQEARRPTRLAEGPLLRVGLLRLAADQHVFLLMMHHIISDGWSFEVFIRELGTLYAAFTQGKPSPLPELPIQYVDFARWQRQWLQGGEMAGLLSYWKTQLAGIPAALELPTDHPRPAAPTFRGSVRNVEVAADVAAGLRTLAREEGASLFMVLLAAFQVLLGRYSGQQDIAVGSPVVNRNRVELEGLIGFFLNTLVLRTRCAGDSGFHTALALVRETVLAAHAHQDLPFEKLVDELQPERHVNRQPLFQVLFTLKNPPQQAGVFTGLRVSPLEVQKGVAKFDLTLSFSERAGQLLAALEYNIDLFEEVTAVRLLDHLENLLRGIVGDREAPVSGLALLGAAERAQVLVEWNDTRVALPPEACVHHLFEAQAARRPDAVALVFEERRLTYGELNRQANRLAHRLRALGAGPGTSVGVCLERSAEMVAAVLGVLKAGAAYVPLDPAYPRERLAYMLDDAAVPVLVTDGGLPDDLSGPGTRTIRLDAEGEGPEPAGEQDPESGADAGDLAYVIYTSGSTGRPKGVQVPHRGVVNIVRFMARELGLTERDRLLAVTTLSFDIAALELYLPLALGACVEVVRRETASDGTALASRLETSAAAVVQATPATWQLLLDTGWPGAEALKALCGGEALSPVLARELAARCGGLWNVYGPTETTIWSTVFRVREESGPVPVGRPIDNTQVHLLAPDLEPVPLGVAGELYIGGLGVSRGYSNQPATTAARFVPDPFSETPGARLYRTGDLARHRRDGQLEFLGRLDTQVKVRGFRVEPGEIETLLLGHPAVRNAAVVAREDNGYTALVAYLVPGEPPLPPLPSIAQLRAFLRESLPDYMVPSSFVVLGSLPLTPSGKVDRRALPAPGGAGPEPDGTFVAPETMVQEMVAGVWAEVLGRQRIGLHDNFFELGGHSLLATRVVSRLRDVFAASLPLRRIFESPTVAGLAAALEAARRRERGAEAPPLLRAPRSAVLPLSFSQERLWFLDQLDPGSPAYNIPFGFRLRGALSLPTLARSLAEVARRHEALRTTFTAREGHGGAVQVISPEHPVRLPLVDLQGVPEAEGRSELERLARDEARHRFDLARGPLLRSTLVRSAADDHILLLVVHHIVFDGWSMGIFLRELPEIYQAFGEERPADLPVLPVQYADFALWQREWLQGAVLEEQLSYWRERLAGLPAALDLPADRPRPAVQTARGALQRVALPEELSARLGALGRRQGCTLFMTLLAAFQVLLSRSSGQPDIPVGTPIANRRRSEIEGLIGFFANTLVLRGELAEDPSFSQLLAQVRRTSLEAYDHQDLPFEKLVEELRPERDPSRSPLFQVMFMLRERARAAHSGLTGLEVEPWALESSTSKFDLSLALEESGGALAGSVTYNPDLFDSGTMVRFAERFVVLLEGIAAAPEIRVSDLPLLTGSERFQLLVQWNPAPAGGFESPGFIVRFEAQAARMPDAVALICGGARLTYGGLAERAADLAHALRNRGVGPEMLVGIYLDRSIEMVVAILATLKSGGAYLPIDPSYPADRVAYMLEDAGVLVLLSRERLLEELPVMPLLQIVDLDRPVRSGAGPVDRGAPEPAGDHLAYVIYTSGSTGRPKGVMISQRGLANYLDWALDAYGAEGGGGSVVHSSISFDLTVTSLFLPLLRGEPVVLVPDAEGVEGLASALRDPGGFGFVKLTPSHARLLGQQLSGGELAGGSRALILGGEALAGEHLEPWRASDPSVWIHNEYGPTETVVGCCLHSVQAGRLTPGPLPIGRPIANTRLYVVDARMRPQPIGVVGELCIGGLGLARGYLMRPELTAAKLVPDPFATSPGERLYRTGDLARFRADGVLEFLGRSDDQVKIRGYRIELGEIESVLTELSGIREAVVVKEEGGAERLFAYFVPVDAGALSIEEIRRSLAERLPQYMVPAAFLPMESLPLTPNGKIDRKALPLPDGGRAQGGGLAAPRTPTEVLLAGIWAEVLRLDPAAVGRGDSFFDLGGHSLLAVQVVSRVREVLQAELPLQALFRSPVLADLAGILQESLESGGGSRHLAIERVPQDGPLPLSFAQQLLWFAHHMDPGRPDYNVPLAIRLGGALDVALLRRSVGEVVRRHEVLRSVFPATEDGPVQIVRPPALDFRFVDLGGLSTQEQEDEVGRLVWEEAARPFDLARGPLLRTALLRLGAEEHVALLTLHHIASDAWSLGVLVREIAAHYQAFSAEEDVALPELPIQYADFSRWQRQWLRDEVLDAQVSYWKRQLGGGVPVLALPTDRPRPPVRRSRGGAVPLSLPEPLAADLRELSRRQGNTLFMTLLSGFAALLHLCSGQEDFAIGTNVANRNRLETEGLIGFFVNQVALRTDLSGDPTGRELLSRCRNVALAAYAHQDLPFDRVVEELRPPRDPSRPPLFQVKFDLLTAPVSALELPGLRVSPLRIDRQVVRYDLHLVLSDSERGINGALQYSSDLFDAATAEQMLDRLKLLLAGLAATPDRRLSELEEGVLESEREARSARQRERKKHNLQGLQQMKRRTGVR